MILLRYHTDDAASDKQEEKDIISELKVLQHVGAHPNIVCLLGASVSNGEQITAYYTCTDIICDDVIFLTMQCTYSISKELNVGNVMLVHCTCIEINHTL